MHSQFDPETVVLIEGPRDPAYGWTDDPEYLAVEHIKKAMAADLGDKCIRPIMRSAPPSEDLVSLFELDDKFYILEELGGEVYRIDHPITEDTIVPMVIYEGIGALEMGESS